MLQLLSAIPGWATARTIDQHDHSLHAKSFNALPRLRCTALLQSTSDLPVVATTKTMRSTWPQMCIEMTADKHARKSNMPKHAEGINAPKYQTWR
jgi:hypothetical protein